jgi:uncharacterized protein
MRRSCLQKYSISCCVVVLLLANRAVAENRPAELQKAYDGGNPQDCKRLGDMYRRSHLPDGGDAKRCGDLGYVYADGLGVPENNAKVVQFRKKACDGGDTGTCIFLGDWYNSGPAGFLPEDKAKAKALYQKACEDWYWVGCVKVKLLEK